MSKPLRITVHLALILVAFCIGVAIAVLRGWGSSNVTLELQNQSGRAIQSYVLHYETCGVKGVITGEAVAATQSRKIRFPVCGEGGYRVEVNFADGRQVTGTAGYVESGYVLSEIVTATAINSSVRTYGF
jgi:hypothetical protein